MTLGSIVYYLLWPIVAFAIALFWIFHVASIVTEICVEYIRGLHEEIKGF